MRDLPLEGIERLLAGKPSVLEVDHAQAVFAGPESRNDEAAQSTGGKNHRRGFGHGCPAKIMAVVRTRANAEYTPRGGPWPTRGGGQERPRSEKSGRGLNWKGCGRGGAIMRRIRIIEIPSDAIKPCQNQRLAGICGCLRGYSCYIYACWDVI